MGELIGMKRTSPSPVAQMTLQKCGEGVGVLGSGFRSHKKTIRVHIGNGL